jgi:hypothetical protein
MIDSPLEHKGDGDFGEEALHAADPWQVGGIIVRYSSAGFALWWLAISPKQGGATDPRGGQRRQIDRYDIAT